MVIFWVAVVAHGLSLGAGFWIDDQGTVVEVEAMSPRRWHFIFCGQRWGDTGEGAVAIGLFQILPQLIHWLTGLSFGADPAAYHFWNLLTHASTAMLIYPTGKKWLRQGRLLADPWTRHQAALLGALIFACHPLATPAVHGVRSLGTQLMTVGLVLITHRTLRFLERPSWANVGWTAAAFLLATLSAPPGGPMALMLLGVTLVGCRPSRALSTPQLLFRPTVLRLSFVSLILAVVGYGTLFWKEALSIHFAATQDQMRSHLLTQGRAVWAHLSAMFLPVRVSAGGEVPWSTSFSDTEAVLKLAGVVGLACVLIFLVWKSRTSSWRSGAALGLMILMPLVLRAAYLQPKAFMDSRAYAALPWTGLVIGAILAWLFSQWTALRWPFTAAVLGTFLLLSWQHSWNWQSPERLARSIAAAHPLDLRSRVYLQQCAFRQGDFSGVLGQSRSVTRCYSNIMEFNSTNPERRFLNVEDAFRWRVESERLVTLALAENYGSHYALAYADHVLEQLVQDAQLLSARNATARTLLNLPIKVARDLIAANAVKIDRKSIRAYPFLRTAEASAEQLRLR